MMTSYTNFSQLSFFVKNRHIQRDLELEELQQYSMQSKTISKYFILKFWTFETTDT